jgi:hypothetical protein
MLRAAFAATALAAVALFTEIPAVGAQDRTEVGRLTCRIGPGMGAIIGSRRRMACRFGPNGGGRVENYSGTITRFGLDIGVTAGGVMTWLVFARVRGFPPGTLAGHYVGASGDVSLGLGVGAKALIGGSRRSTVLQPFSTVGQVGVNLALGVAGLTLRFKGSSVPPS